MSTQTDPAAPPADTVITTSWAYALRSEFLAGALHRTLYADVRLAGHEGCGPAGPTGPSEGEPR
jgi:hypothetical protein